MGRVEGEYRRVRIQSILFSGSTTWQERFRPSPSWIIYNFAFDFILWHLQQPHFRHGWIAQTIHFVIWDFEFPPAPFQFYPNKGQQILPEVINDLRKVGYRLVTVAWQRRCASASWMHHEVVKILRLGDWQYSTKEILAVLRGAGPWLELSSSVVQSWLASAARCTTILNVHDCDGEV